MNTKTKRAREAVGIIARRCRLGPLDGRVVETKADGRWYRPVGASLQRLEYEPRVMSPHYKLRDDGALWWTVRL